MKPIFVISILLLLTIVSTSLVAQDRTVIFFRGDAVGSNQTLAYGINDLRQVAGTVGGEVGTGNGFIWYHGQFTQTFVFGAPAPPFLQDTNVFAINNRGDTVGIHFGNVPGDTSSSFIRDKYGAFTVLAPVQGELAPIPLGINDFGWVVGSYLDTTASTTFGFLRSPRGRYTKIHYPGSASTSATAINEYGEITGSFTTSNSPDAPSVGYLHRNGHFVRTFQCKLNGVPQSTNPVGINAWGQIIGRCGPAGQQQNFLRERSGRISFIDTSQFDAPAFINGINNRGDVVGFFSGPRPLSIESFVIFGATKPF